MLGAGRLLKRSHSERGTLEVDDGRFVKVSALHRPFRSRRTQCFQCLLLLYASIFNYTRYHRTISRPLALK